MTVKLTRPLEPDEKPSPLVRESQLVHHTRAVNVELHPAEEFRPERIVFHVKGTRQRVSVPLEEVFRYAQRRALAGGR